MSDHNPLSLASTPSSSLDSLDSTSSDAILAAALGLSLELGGGGPSHTAAAAAGSSSTDRVQLQAQAAYRQAGPGSMDMQVDAKDDADVSMTASIDDDRVADNDPVTTAAGIAMPRPFLPHNKRKRRPSSLPSIDSLLVLIPPPAHLEATHARTPPPTSAHHPAPAASPGAVALAAEPDAIALTHNGPASPLLLTPLDPLASLLSAASPSSAAASPPCTPTLPPHFRRARGGSSAPRPSSLLAKLDHLPMELLHLIAEFVAGARAAGLAADDPMLATRTHTQLAHLARASTRVYSAVAPVLYVVPAVESVAQLRRLVVSLQVAAVRTLLGAGGKCRVHPVGALVPVFAYVRGLDIARLEDGARGKREVAALVARVVKVARARSVEDVRQVVVTMSGCEAVDPTLGRAGACTCLARVAAAGDVREGASGHAHAMLRRTASNGDLHLLAKADAPTATTAGGVYGMDLSSSTSPSLASTPPSPTTPAATTEYLPPPRLTHINLSFIKSLAPSLLTTLLLAPMSAPLRLTHLNLSGTHLPDSLLASLLSISAPTLTRLSLAWNPHLTDLALASLATPGGGTAPLKITHLDLTHCRDLSDWSLAKLAPLLPHLRALGIAWCPRISGRVVHAALSYWPHLRALSVAGCPRVGGREAVMRMWDGYVVADVELRRRVGRVSELVGGEAAAGGRGVGVVERVQRLRVDEQGMGGCVYYLDV